MKFGFKKGDFRFPPPKKNAFLYLKDLSDKLIGSFGKNMKYFHFLPSSDHGEDQLLANCFATPTKKNKIGKSRREPQELDVRGENQENEGKYN